MPLTTMTTLNYDQAIEAVLATMSLHQFFLSAAVACDTRGLHTIADHCRRIAAQITLAEGRQQKKRKPRSKR